jgi:hypothetical protein
MFPNARSISREFIHCAAEAEILFRLSTHRLFIDAGAAITTIHFGLHLGVYDVWRDRPRVLLRGLPNKYPVHHAASRHQSKFLHPGFVQRLVTASA